VKDQAIEMLLKNVIYAIPLALIATLLFLLLRRQAAKRPTQPFAQPEGPVVRAYLSELTADNVEVISKRIEAATAANDKTALAGLYLALARGYEKLGDDEARMSALRSAAGCGALHGPHALHAEARMQLAEAAYTAGDLTTACEQWHLARGAFLESGQMQEHARVEKRMRENGCPTDWVLTDF
jgi:hypothetical protein